MTHQLPVHLLVTIGIVAGGAACSRPGQDAQPAAKTNTAAPAPSDVSPAPVPQSVVLNGCLQEGTRGAYILTELNEPKHPDSSKPGVIAQERTDAARHAYRLLSTRETDLSKLVGKQVNVEGKETQEQVPPVAEATTGNAGAKNGKTTRIKQDDLAKVQVDSIRALGKPCGRSTHRKAKSKRT
jgi:hypothetical protein